MEQLIINERNEKRINEAISEIEGKSTARTVTFRDILQATSILEKKLGVPKKAMEGASYTVDVNAQTMPHAYKYDALSTQIRIERIKGSWRVVDISRDKVKSNVFIAYKIPEALNAAILALKMRMD